MQVCRFQDREQRVRIGLVHEHRVFDVTPTIGSITDLLSHPAPADLWRHARETTQGREAFSLAELDTRSVPATPHLLIPLDQQEVWAAGVTYRRSQRARMEESDHAADCYDRVYDAPRPELFLKATPHRAVGPNAPIIIRRDASWSVPEPELTLVISPRKQLVGFTIGNDVSSRDIEGENPLYLPQAKTYMGAASVGPVITLVEGIADPLDLGIELRIGRGGSTVFKGRASTAQLKRTFDELIDYLGREQSFPYGVMLMTGTCIVPEDDFTLQANDIVDIEIDGIGTLRNPVMVGPG